MKTLFKAGLLASAAMSMGVAAFADDAPDAEARLGSIIVVGEAQTYSSTETTEAMALQQSPVTSVLAQIDNLPGVNVNEGDVFGFDDWSTSLSLRGFQTNLSEQQVGITVDGLPNGGSNYGGGAKANRYIDSQNAGGIEVFQGTADIASRSNDALGGTINFTTQNPLDEERTRVSFAIGDHDAQRIYGRYDTGRIFNDTTAAWISISTQEATDWMEGSAENERQHIAAKVISEQFGWDWTGYISFDDTHEDNYQRLYSLTDFETYPEWDQLIGDWTGIPYVDQVYRRGWSTLRENLFMYARAEKEFDNGLDLEFNLYRHDNDGRGDWVPPYLAQVFDDGTGNPESEFTGANQAIGTPITGRIYFVDPMGVALTADPTCVSSITFPYGGAGAAYDPACYPANAIPVQSYRHTHYQKERTGFTADFSWETQFESFLNTLRGGVWYEDATRYEYRDWHKITDTTIGHNFDYPAYYVQYNNEYPQSTTKFYLEDTVEFGNFTARFGMKFFDTEIERVDLFDASNNTTFSADSGVLLSGGLAYQVNDNLELFAGYAENFKAINDLILERPAADVTSIEPETADVFEAGARFRMDRFTGSATFFDAEFANRLVFASPGTSTGPNYDIGTNGTFFNVGGIESQGLELAGTFEVNDNVSLYSAYTYNGSSYIGTGDPALDALTGIVPGRQVAGVPENMFVVSADFDRDNFFGGVSAKYVDDREVYGFSDGFTMPSYTVADLYAGVRGEAISDRLTGLEFLITVNNLFDERYLGTHDFNSGAWLGAARTTVLTVTADF